MKTIERRSDCPVSYSLDIFGDKWSLLILRDMIFYNKSSFSEFMCSSEKPASNILVSRLNVLTAEGFLSKRPSPANKSKFIYSLNDKAIELVPLLVELFEWGAKYNPAGSPEDILKRLKKNKSKAIREIQEQLKAERENILLTQEGV